ncbi:MAG TPA: adenylate/guanylate cyclase domain-containing protein [Solirubrobacteraceae bacterium]|nr:adenylate/guanylate cyclase domain-containing protein [Solirubrobacteraceae bacterium]
MRGAATVCPRCGTDNVSGAKFCTECGSSLATSCPGCGSVTAPGQNFCSECGAPLSPRSASTQVAARGASSERGPAGAGSPSSARRRDAAELRTVSVLFVDLVGYTSLSEALDPEDVRDLLGHYFDAARRIVDRYGGTIEKFIGDAVMAVWGTPVAREDDVERAVRAALELVDAVAALRHEARAPDLQARAGVVTGQAALLVKPEEGVVVGDRVNTAARVQAAAEPGTVLVDDITRQVTSTAIAYDDAGHHELKGKAEPVHLWRAVEVLAGSGLDREGLRARFVGRDADLRLVKELFHAGVSRRSVRLVAISGAAGVGKSRLRAEFLEYLMQLPDRVLWHPGRCLPYGDGVAYWALTEMVRHRLGLPEDASEEETQAKLAAGLESWIDDPAEREFVSVRLGVLLGVAEAGASREELFAGWRLFFERLSEHDPVVMAFEDMHWADDGLLDFVEYLVDWSSQHPIFILVLARPEVAERRPGWPGGHRGAAVGYLDPLGERAMEELLDSVATLPIEAKHRIISHAEGIPLYAIETVRALADRGALVERDGALVLAGELGELDVPPSLISLLGARLDALTPGEREIVKTMSVFAGNFPLAAVQALSGLPAAAAGETLAALVRKQVLTVQADPLSPDRGQYRFAQLLLRTVAYDMLTKRERQAGHLAAAEYLSRAFAHEGEDVAEVVAAHYLQAYRCASAGADAERLRTEAVSALRRGGQRAAAVGAPQTAERAYRKAIEIAVNDEERIELIAAAADMALVDGRYDDALELFTDAATRLEQAGRMHDAARLGPGIGQALFRGGRAGESIEHLEQALATLGADAEDGDVTRMNVTLGVALLDTGRVRSAFAPLNRALELAQTLELPGELASALTFKAQLCVAVGRVYEAGILFDGAAKLCQEHTLTNQLVSIQVNSGDFLNRFDLPDSAERAREALHTARRIGSRYYESLAASNLMRAFANAGEWDELQRLGTELLAGSDARPGAEPLHFELAMLAAFRGDIEVARDHLARIVTWRASQNNQLRWFYSACQAMIAVVAREFADAIDLVAGGIEEIVRTDGPSSQASRIGFPAAVDAALALGRLADVENLLSLLAARPAGQVPPYMHAQLSRGHGLLASARGEWTEAEAQLGAAIEGFRSLGFPYWLAGAQTDLAEVFVHGTRLDEAGALLDEARAAFSRLGAAPALQRAEAILARDGTFSLQTGRATGRE